MEKYINSCFSNYYVGMSRTAKLLVALVVIVIAWKLYSTVSTEPDVEYEPTA